MSKLSVGGGLDFLVPLDPKGNTTRWSEGGHNVIGNHRGNSAGLCVANPNPGTVVQWARRRDDSLLGVRQRGWRVVHQGDGPIPAYMLGDDDTTDRPTPLDTTLTFGGLCLVETSEENFRRLQGERDREALARLRGANDSFLDGTTDREPRGRDGRSRSRLLRRDHGIFFNDGEDAVGASRTDEE